MTWQDACPHDFGGVCTLVFLYGCRPARGRINDCPVNFGEWGAWRSILSKIQVIACVQKTLAFRTDCDALRALGATRISAHGLLNATGWSA